MLSSYQVSLGDTLALRQHTLIGSEDWDGKEASGALCLDGQVCRACKFRKPTRLRNILLPIFHVTCFPGL